MNEELLEILRCARCRGGLAGMVMGGTGQLQCRECEARFPVRSGVPRLAAQHYVASFGRQWNRYDVVREEEDEAVFRAKTGIDPEELVGLRVLDAGCGGGRYTRLLARRGVQVLGVDLSEAVDKAAEVCGGFPNALITQADLLDMPLAAGGFDLVFSIGVLHHCPNPRKAFEQVARQVKPGGRLAVWLYRRNMLLQEAINASLRAVTTRTPPAILERLCAGLGVLGGMPVVKQSLNKVFNFSNHRDFTLRVCDNFDWYAPRYQSHHTMEELKSWFAEEGFVDLQELAPSRSGRVYDFAYRNSLIIGSGVNVLGRKPA